MKEKAKMSKKRKKTVKNIDKTETVEKPKKTVKNIEEAGKNRQKYRKTGKSVEKPVKVSKNR